MAIELSPQLTSGPDYAPVDIIHLYQSLVGIKASDKVRPEETYLEDVTQLDTFIANKIDWILDRAPQKKRSFSGKVMSLVRGQTNSKLGREDADYPGITESVLFPVDEHDVVIRRYTSRQTHLDFVIMPYTDDEYRTYVRDARDKSLKGIRVVEKPKQEPTLESWIPSATEEIYLVNALEWVESQLPPEETPTEPVNAMEELMEKFRSGDY
jgi:hypothetical protein